MRVGLTGGIGSGKSTVATMLRDLGAVVIDADLLAREVVEPGTPGLAAVVEAFGDEVLTAEGSLDRGRLGEIVFADPDRLATLNAIVHPLVRARSQELEAEAPAGALVVHDIPLLAETGQADRFEAVIVVDAPTEIQLKRLAEHRRMEPEHAALRIAAQASREERRGIATHVIENDGTWGELRARVAEVYEDLVSTDGD